MLEKLLLLIVIGGMLIAINKNPRDNLEKIFGKVGYIIMMFSVWLSIIKLIHDFILTRLI